MLTSPAFWTLLLALAGAATYLLLGSSQERAVGAPLIMLGPTLVGLIVLWLTKRKRHSLLPSATEDEFLAAFEGHQASRDSLLAARKLIADTLSIPAEKLAPNTKLRSFVRDGDVFGAMALDDLSDELGGPSKVGIGATNINDLTVGELALMLAQSHR